MAGSVWRVVGGADKGGILVRSGRDLTSAALSTRLSTGALVKEIDLVGERLRFQRLEGTGPQDGWVSIRISGKDLLVRAEAEQRKTIKNVPIQETSHTRVYEVVRVACTVHAEPHVEAPVVSMKSKGMKVLCSEVTMNGWLRLAADGGWMLMSMFGATEGLGEVARIVGDSPTWAVSEYQPQGICCLEVVAQEGLTVCSAPTSASQAIGTRRSGEFVFAKRQTFDGWVRLCDEDGWALASSSRGPRKPILRARDTAGLDHIDLWALCEAWAAARRHRGRGQPLPPADVDTLRRLERTVSELVHNRFNEYLIGGNAETLISANLISERQLAQPTPWIKQSMFANALERLLPQVPTFKELVVELAPYERIPPLPVAEESELGAMGFWSAACMPFEFNGATYMMAPNGLMIDPASQEPVGMWNHEIEEVVPLTMIQQDGVTLMVSPDGSLFDPVTLDVVGRLDLKTQGASTTDSECKEEDLLRLESPRSNDDAPQDTQLASIQRHLDWAEQNAKRRCWNMAAEAYTKALDVCEAVKAVDVEVEEQIIRGRALCWQHLHRLQDLGIDALRLQKLCGQKVDADVEAWLRLAGISSMATLEASHQKDMSRRKPVAVTMGAASARSNAGPGSQVAGSQTDVEALDGFDRYDNFFFDCQKKQASDWRSASEDPDAPSGCAACTDVDSMD